jgi:hypothetical protein
MTDLATGIGAATSTEPVKTEPVAAGNSSQGDSTNSQGSGVAAGSTDPSREPAGNSELEWAKTKGWVAEDGSYKTVEALKAYQALEKQMSSTTRVPDEKAKPEEWDAYYKKMGRPDEAAKYDFKPDNLPKDMPYDEKMATEFKNWAFKENLSAKSAAALHDNFVNYSAEALKADVAAFEADVISKAKAAHSNFVQNWGEPTSEGYKQNQEAARRALRGDPKLAALEPALTAAGLLTKDGNFTSFELGHLLSSHGKQFMNDSFVAPNGLGRSAQNPFLRLTANGKPNPDYNLTEQARLMKQNPEQARQFMSAAGEG